jgi:hypothetical protein
MRYRSFFKAGRGSCRRTPRALVSGQMLLSGGGTKPPLAREAFVRRHPPALARRLKARMRAPETVASPEGGPVRGHTPRSTNEEQCGCARETGAAARRIPQRLGRRVPPREMPTAPGRLRYTKHYRFRRYTPLAEPPLLRLAHPPPRCPHEPRRRERRKSDLRHVDDRLDPNSIGGGHDHRNAAGERLAAARADPSIHHWSWRVRSRTRRNRRVLSSSISTAKGRLQTRLPARPGRRTRRDLEIGVSTRSPCAIAPPLLVSIPPIRRAYRPRK